MAVVLVADDAADLRLLMRLTLQSAGFDVLEAAGGVDALNRLDQLRDLDLIVLDVQMPMIDGWMVLETIRSHPVHGEVPVLMCTVKSSHDDLVRAWELGCDGYVNKPFDLPILIGEVERLVDSDPSARLQHRQAQLDVLRSTSTTR